MSEDFQAKPPEIDLLGDPWREIPDARGRKPHAYDPQVAVKIALCRAGGGTEQECADRVGLSIPTLRKYYFRALEKGPKLVKALIDEAQLVEALKGKTSAARYIAEQIEKGAAAVPLAPSSRPEPDKPTEKLGKKAEANEAAQSAHEGTEWGSLLN